ncbi:MAG: hypothetical protein U0791_16400 [Gemmataceae bacterium]
MPRDHWLTAAERKAIIDFHHQYPLEGYRRLTYMMIDRNIVACSPATVYRVLSQAGLLQRWKPKTSLRNRFRATPPAPRALARRRLLPQHRRHLPLPVFRPRRSQRRAIVHWDIRERMTEADIEQIIQKGKECHPGVTPRIITDNGPQFLAKDFKEFIRISGMTHVKTSPYYPKATANSNDSTAP